MVQNTANPGQRLERFSVMEQTLTGLEKVLSIISADYGKKPVAIASQAGQWAQREIGKQNGGNMVYPFLSVSLQQFQRNRNSYNENLRRFGINAKASVLSNQVNRYRLIPVILDCRVEFTSQNFAEALAWSQLMINRDKDVRFAIKNADLEIKIKVVLGENFSFPDPETTDFATTIYRVQTNCLVETYLGDVEARTKITKIVVTANLINGSNGYQVPEPDLEFSYPPKAVIPEED